ncbi:FAD binding domain-containing protein [Dehalobacterium formicoaceticum]|nr:FAD binding domain-containing protein [Dehalobacterium formicoaceticum]
MEAYFRPGTIEEALNLLAENKGKILAGGTDLILDLQKKEMPGTIVDVGGIRDLCQIKETEDQVIMGSGVTFTQAETSPIIKKHLSKCILRSIHQAEVLFGFQGPEFLRMQECEKKLFFENYTVKQ